MKVLKYMLKLGALLLVIFIIGYLVHTFMIV